MADTKVLQAILDGQVSIREDIKRLESKVDQGFKNVNERIDNVGLSVANLEDDAPTVEEFDHLEKRVGKLEQQFALA